MRHSEIKSIKAREILDSGGSPTVEVDLITGKALFRASIPSGVSKGKYEALELRDGGERYGGMGVLKAVKNVNEIIAPKLIGKDPTKQKEIDQLIIELDGTENKSNLGANAILGISVAVCRAGAAGKNLPLYRHIKELAGSDNSLQLPTPVLLMIEGGLHAGNKLDVQEFMIVPLIDSGEVPSGKIFKEKLRVGTEIYNILGTILRKKYGDFATNVGCEGGFAPILFQTQKALDLIMEAIEKSGYKEEAKIILDVAASHFFKDGVYKFEGSAFTKEGLLNFYSEIVKNYPILGLEDPFAQDDFEGFVSLNKKIGKEVIIIGDDLLVTNPERIKKAKEKNACSGLVLKMNQIGTITETIMAAKLAFEAGWEVFVKHRSGETEDSFIADLAVGLGAKYIMAGALNRGERLAKYNRLLRIEEELNKS